MGTEKKYIYMCVFLESPVWLFFSEYEKRRDKKLSKLHILDYRALKRNVYFWSSIAQLVLANSCAYCRQLRKSLFSGNKQSRDKNTFIFSVRCHAKFVPCKVCQPTFQSWQHQQDVFFKRAETGTEPSNQNIFNNVWPSKVCLQYLERHNMEMVYNA